MEYIAYLHKDRYSDFGVGFPDFPGCVTVGRTLEEARESQVEQIDARAKKFGLTRSAQMVQSSLGGLDKKPRRSATR